MSVIIKGMDMPKECSRCRLLEGDTMDGLCHGVEKWFDDDYFYWGVYAEGDIDDSKPLNCPLVEVPTPHGRLIDEKQIPYIDLNADMPQSKVRVWATFKDKVDRVPTIIEAEEGEGK